MVVYKRSGFRPGVAAKISARARIVGRHIGRRVRVKDDTSAAGIPAAFLEAEVGAERGTPVRYVLAVLQEQPGHTGGDQGPLYIVKAGPTDEVGAALPLSLVEAVRAFQIGALRSARIWGLAKNRRRLGAPEVD